LLGGYNSTREVCKSTGAAYRLPQDHSMTNQKNKIRKATTF
jgi:hypothetical protein